MQSWKLKSLKKQSNVKLQIKCPQAKNCPQEQIERFYLLAANVGGLWSGGGFETRPPERLPI